MAKSNKKDSFINSRGGRKTSSASVWLWEKAKAPVAGIVINDKSPQEYFSDIKTAEGLLLRPFEVCNVVGKFSASVKVSGGGKMSQLDAVVLGLAKALAKKDVKFKALLRRENLLTRDSRMVESKKYGRHKARRGQQFSKR